MKRTIVFLALLASFSGSVFAQNLPARNLINPTVEITVLAQRQYDPNWKEVASAIVGNRDAILTVFYDASGTKPVIIHINRNNAQPTNAEQQYIWGIPAGITSFPFAGASWQLTEYGVNESFCTLQFYRASDGKSWPFEIRVHSYN